MSKIKLPHASGNSMSIAAPATNPASDLELKLPATIGTANQVVANSAVAGTLAFATLPLNEVDQWMVTASKTSDGYITSDLARSSYTGSGVPVGTGMTESSGDFTFPSTGKWVIIVQASWTIDGSDNCTLDTYMTTNNSSYTMIGRAMDANNGTGARSAQGLSINIVDITNTTNCKVKFAVGSLGGNSLLYSDGTAYVLNSFTFLRIGDT